MVITNAEEMYSSAISLIGEYNKNHDFKIHVEQWRRTIYKLGVERIVDIEELLDEEKPVLQEGKLKNLKDMVANCLYIFKSQNLGVLVKEGGENPVYFGFNQNP